jgi:hypothetical protein
LWLSYFHSDAGERKTVNVYIDLVAGGKAHLKVSGYDDHRLIADKTVRTADSSGENPVDLYWP